ncbi:MAG TPA: isocitrate lyase/phosphoenolpyruvate mutase family protein [Actinophytocola sp.]|uniref:isocitrate lyase/PEP mutase family protein n=1 Tax=Actinophytocola sp. TaxID=1872138 RepID=UPI002DDCFA6A|nr:isocitrate lyase/phosphoenolpyruvate mutase family protein [Actinophytocola sp.]HEV2782364.1 isocitrate lyase/phosphoenolpyruvate mutase family protein [Actinophytocola sp.]
MTTFRELHRTGEPLLLPNAWDYASAAALAEAGFAAIGTTSLGVAAAHGLPDGHGLARSETVALARLLHRLPCPFTVDIEAGFGADPAEVADLATELASLGAAGVNLEDGRPHGTLADPARQVELIEAVKRATPDLFVNARIDTYWLGVDDSTAERADRYTAAGADGIFVPGLADEDRIRELLGTIAVPLNILYLPHRHTVRRLAELGVRRISTGSLLYRTGLHAAVGAALAIRDGEPIPLNPPGYAEIQRLSQ